jgi:beta-galactosidase GanA
MARWMRIDLASLLKSAGKQAIADELNKSASMTQSPAQQVAMLPASSSIKDEGSETVGGVRAEHYQGTLTMDEVVKNAGTVESLSSSDRTALLDEFQKMGMKTSSTQVWVGQDGYPVRVAASIAMKTGTTSTVTDYSDYSDYSAQAVHVQVPPAGQTIDFQDILKEAQKQSGAAG